ncbi:MAG: hypothetical protein ACK56I_35490, partial [bacterium]
MVGRACGVVKQHQGNGVGAAGVHSHATFPAPTPEGGQMVQVGIGGVEGKKATLAPLLSAEGE